MKGFACIAALLTILLLFPAMESARLIHRRRSHNGHDQQPPTRPSSSGDMSMVRPDVYGKRRGVLMKHKRADTLQVAGSSLPNCLHACGSCSPCRLVTVSFVCATLEEAETCPMAYKCMCHNKSYPVP